MVINVVLTEKKKVQSDASECIEEDVVANKKTSFDSKVPFCQSTAPKSKCYCSAWRIINRSLLKYFLILSLAWASLSFLWQARAAICRL